MLILKNNGYLRHNSFDAGNNKMILKNKLIEKFQEALAAVLPIVTLVLILSLFVAPIPSGIMLSFFMGTIMLIGGMMFFSVGAEVAM